jgi:hypothetical protein
MNRTLVLLVVLGVAGGVWHFHKQSKAVDQSADAAAMSPVSAPLAPAMDAPASSATRGVAGGNPVDVYGRTGCGYTRKMIAELERTGIPMRFHDIDYPQTRAAFQERFADSGLATSRGYALPVIAVAGQELARPQPSSVIYAYRHR